MKKICFISLNNASPWGGSEILWSSVAKRLAANKEADVYAIMYNWGKESQGHIAALEAAGVHVYSFSPHYNWLVRVYRLMRKFTTDYFLNKVKHYLARIKPDFVVHTNMAPRGYDVLDWVVKNKVAYCLDIQLADEYLWHKFDNRMLDCYTNAKAVFFLCSSNQKSTEKQLGLSLLNARRHYNPINVSYSEKLSIKEDAPVKFACVGRLAVEHKRQDLILEVLSAPVWRNRNWELHLYGSGPHQESILRLIHFYDLSDRVFLHGHVVDIDKIWCQNQVLLLPSTYEAVPMAVTEAMFARRVVVTTNVGVAADVIQHGYNGFKCAGPTLLEFNNAMEDAWANKHKWTTIAENAHGTIKQEFPQDAVNYFAEQILSLVYN